MRLVPIAGRLVAWVAIESCGRGVGSRNRTAHPTVPARTSPGTRNVPATETPIVTPTESSILRVGGDVLEPSEISRVAPVFPTTCGKSRFQGLFIFEATIDTHGTVTNVRTLRGISARPPCPELETECKRALSLWRYKPATLRGVPVPVYLTITLSFHFR